MATQAAAMRAKLFGGSTASASSGMTASMGAHTTEALRQATDKLLREQHDAEVKVSLYRNKLGEAQTAVKRLEEAYVAQNQTTARLQGAPQGRRRAGGGGGCRLTLNERCHPAS
jgi:hypothetical protein